jgi:hypothetical protein
MHDKPTTGVMPVSTLIDIAWPELDVFVVAELNDERNPELVSEFVEHLPFRVLQSHPVVSGESTYAWVPIVSTAKVSHRERIVDCPIGTLRYSQGTGNKLSVQYGVGLEPVLQPILGWILPEYQGLLPNVGRKVWDSLFWSKNLIFVDVRVHGEDLKSSKPKAESRHPAALLFLEEAKRVEMIEPEDLTRIRRGEVANTGSYGQYFTAWDFANGMIRDYIVYTIYPLLGLADELTPAQISLILDRTDPPYTDYLGYSGLQTLQRFAGILREEVKRADDPEVVKELLKAFLRYGNRLNAWSHHYFPWHFGAFFGRKDINPEFPGRVALGSEVQS